MDESDNPDIELEERSPGGPGRRPSLESQRQRRPSPWILRLLMGKYSLPWILRWLLLDESRVIPQLSGQVHDAIKAGAKAYRSDARSFISDFDRTSQHPESPIQEIFDFFIRLCHIETESEGTTGTFYHHVSLPLITDHY